MPVMTPTPCANGIMQYYPPTDSIVLVNTANSPAYLQMTVNTWTWNGVNWNLTNAGLANNPTPRINTSAAYDGTNMVLFGGRGMPGTELMCDTWTWNGSTWSNPIPNYTQEGFSYGVTNGLTIREGAYMAPMTGGVILFGGTTPYFTMRDTWFWNGSTWAVQNPTVIPSIRVGASFASNGTNNAILFGGANGSQMLNDTWSWNGSNWAQLTTNTPPSAPSVRQGAAMAWYPTGSYFLLFGGVDTSGDVLYDTWKFDGVSTWTNLAPTNNPSCRTGAMMAYDSNSSQMILFGGKNSKNLLNDTWQWNGTNWV